MGISEECSEMLLNYEWPGNIRELKNMLERVVLLEDDEILRSEHLPISGRAADTSLSAVRRLENALLRPIPEPGIDFDRLVSDVEIDLIVKASRQCTWNQSRTAELLRMKRDKLRYRMKIYNIVSERKRGPGRPGSHDENGDELPDMESMENEISDPETEQQDPDAGQTADLDHAEK